MADARQPLTPEHRAKISLATKAAHARRKQTRIFLTRTLPDGTRQIIGSARVAQNIAPETVEALTVMAQLAYEHVTRMADAANMAGVDDLRVFYSREDA